jgi:hypothetical protein
MRHSLGNNLPTAIVGWRAAAVPNSLVFLSRGASSYVANFLPTAESWLRKYMVYYVKGLNKYGDKMVGSHKKAINSFCSGPLLQMSSPYCLTEFEPAL